MSTSRSSTLMRSAAAAALACFVAADAYASDPVPPATPADQAAASAAEPSLSLLDRMKGDEPLFLFGTQPNGAAPAAEEEVNWGMKGVLRDPRGKLFAINSQDGNEMLRVGATGRFFFSTLYYEPFDGADEELETGFEFADLQAYASGGIPNPNLKYYFMVEYQEGSATLADAWLLWANSEGNWGIRAGQFRDVESLEWLIAENRQLAAHRSLAHELLNGDNRVQGASFIFAPNDKMRGEVAVHDGFFSSNTDFFDSIDDSFHVGVSARFEWLMQGLWEHYKSFSSYGMEEEDSLMALGGGVSMSWEDGDDRDGHLTGDFMWKRGKIGAFAAVHVNPIWQGGDDFMNYGGTAQVSFMANEKFEPFARGSIVIADDELIAPDAEDTFFELTLGTNWFPFPELRDRFRMIADFNILPNGSPFDLSGPNYPGTEEMIFTVNVGGELRL